MLVFSSLQVLHVAVDHLEGMQHTGSCGISSNSMFLLMYNYFTIWIIQIVLVLFYVLYAVLKSTIELCVKDSPKSL